MRQPIYYNLRLPGIPTLPAPIYRLPTSDEPGNQAVATRTGCNCSGALKNGLSSFDSNRYALIDTMKDTSDSNIVKTFSAMAEGARTAAASVNATSGSIVKDLAFIGGGIKGLWTSLSAFGKIGLIAGIGYDIYKIADALIVTGEEANQAMTDSFDTYKSSTASVDELNSKLSETQAKINELSTKGGLTIVEQGELDKLNEQNKLLQMELDLKEKIARDDAISAGESAVTSFKRTLNTPTWQIHAGGNNNKQSTGNCISF